MKYFSLTNKLILLFTLNIVLIVVIVLTYSFTNIGRVVEDQIHKDLVAVAEGTEGQIYFFFEKHKVQIMNWGSDDYIRRNFEYLLSNKQDTERREALMRYLVKHKTVTDPTVLITDIFDTDGTVVVSTHKERVGHVEPIGELNEEYKFDNARNASFGEAFVSIPTKEDEEGHSLGVILWHVSTPIFSGETGNVIGVMVNHVMGSEINDILTGEWQVARGALSGKEFIFNQETSEMFLVNKDGFMITPSRFDANSVFSSKVDNTATRACFERGDEFSGKYISYLGYEVESASMCFPSYGVVLITEVAAHEILRPFYALRSDIWIFSTILSTVSMIMVYSLSTFFLRNIRKVRFAANEVLKNNYRVRASVNSADEIGDLARVFNGMLDNIEYSQNEIRQSNEKLREAYGELERTSMSLEIKVKERTKELEDIKKDLESKVNEKTVELRKHLDELERFNKVFIGRELRMVELKKEITDLKEQMASLRAHRASS